MTYPDGLNVLGQVGVVLERCTKPLEGQQKGTGSCVCRQVCGFSSALIFKQLSHGNVQAVINLCMRS